MKSNHAKIFLGLYFGIMMGLTIADVGTAYEAGQYHWPLPFSMAGILGLSAMLGYWIGRRIE